MKKKVPFYKNLKLQTKFTITHLVIATIPMLALAVFFHFKLYDMIIADTIRVEQENSARSIPYINDFIDEINTHFDIIENSALFDDYETLENTIDNVVNNSIISDVRIYISPDTEEEVDITEEQLSHIVSIDEAKGTYWHGIFSSNSKLKYLYCPSFYLSPYETKNLGTLAYIKRTTVNIKNTKKPCYLAMYYSDRILNKILSKNISDDLGVAYLINERDSIVATSNKALSGVYHFDYDTIQEYFMSSNNFIEKEILGKTVYAIFYNIRGPEWYMVVALSSEPIMNKAQSFMTIFLGIYILCIIISLLIATGLSKSMTGRLTSIIDQMSKVKYGLPVALPDSETNDEIGELIDNYNHMTKLINKLMEAEKKASNELRIAEFNSLQAQINPHFLYNTMDMINWLSQQGRPNDVTTAISNLSKFYKLTLSRKKSISTIEDEIEHVSIYVKLQNMRFHDTIELLVDMPDELMECSIPKLTFQPIVENSILHGILEQENKTGTIVLTGWIEDGDIVILISDDGAGMSKETLDNILSGNIESRQGSSIGVYNTHRRLQILYGPLYGLSYKSTPNEGTEVEIRIPLN